MATFTAKKLELTQINGGQEYEQGDFLQSDTINDVVEGTAYAQNVAEGANTKSNNAVSTANSANSTANAASAKVDTFEQRITTAQNTADTAVSNAATAQSTADSATTEINKIKNGTTVVPNANHANNADNAAMATKAQQDVNGNPINTTYATVEYVDDLVTEKQGTRITVNNVNVAELSFASDPQTQITANKNAIAVIPDTYALLPTSVTNTGRASGQWVVGAGSTPETGKTMLLGTFSISDTNIWLHISGGSAIVTAANTTDVNVFISSSNGVVEEAYCYVRKLYKSSRTTGIYYTVDSSNYLRIYAAVPQYGKMFVSAEISGGSIAGKGSSEDAYPSDGQYIPEKNYADLSQVVTKDNSTSSINAKTDAAKYFLRNKQVSMSGESINATGWYRIAKLPTYSSSRITVTKQYNYGRGISLILDVAVGADNTEDATTNIVAAYAGMKGQSNYIDKIRYKHAGSGQVYIDVHITSDSNANSYWLAYDGTSAYSTSFTSSEFALYPFQQTSDTGGTELPMPEDTGLATTGTIYQQGAPVFATDPSKLTPSTANGWTQTTATGSLPSAGVYMVIPNMGSVGALYGIGVMFYGANNTSVSAIGHPVGPCALYYNPSGSTKWLLFGENGTSINLTDVYYKRIA